MIKITRYCPACKHTTKHLYDEKTGTATCLCKTHQQNVVKSRK